MAAPGEFAPLSADSGSFTITATRTSGGAENGTSNSFTVDAGALVVMFTIEWRLALVVVVAAPLMKSANLPRKVGMIAAQGILPFCQDTGTATVVAKKGQQVWTGVNDAEWAPLCALSRSAFSRFASWRFAPSSSAPTSRAPTSRAT